MTPTFVTERLVARPIQLADAASYEKNFADYEVISQLSDQVPWPYPTGGVHDYLQNVILPKQGNNFWTWALTRIEDPTEVIGTVDLWRHGCPENRGFWLGQKYWGQGLMTEALAPITSYAFEHLSFSKLVLSNAFGNTRSRRIKEKSGAHLVAVVPGRFLNPNYTLKEVWELKQEDWLR
jgi:ribosomal-protein-alanine N-acetyltransferase